MFRYQELKLRALAGLAAFVARRPRLVLGAGALLTAASIVVTLAPVPLPFTGAVLGPLDFQSNRNDLISKRLEWNQRFIRWQEGFSGTSDLLVVADAGPADDGRDARAAAVRAMIDELGPALNAAPWIRRAVWGFDTLAVSPKAIRVADLDESKPSDEFRELLVDVKDAPLLLSSPVPEAFIAQVAARMQAEEESGTDAETIKDLRSFAGVLDAFTASVRNEGDEPTDIGRLILERERESGLWQYLVTDNNRMYFIRITPELDTSQINALAPAIASARSVMAKVLARHPKVDAGLTGIDVVEADETEAATRDGIVASLLAATLIMLLMLSAFQSVRMPLMLMAALLAGIAWTFGFTTLAVGHLQVISVVFVPILLGLGIAYGIYLALRYERIRHTYRDDMEGCVAAMRDTYRVMGPGVLTGCLTTAAAFMMTLTTDFTGVAEMGLISGVGVILCLISMVTVFPALLRFFKPWHRHIVPVGRRFVRYYDDRWFMPFVRHPALTLGTGAVLTALSVLAAAGLQFDYNLLKLQPAGMPSVDWERRIVDDAGESIWFGVSIVGDMEEARERAERFRRLSTVSVVRGVGLLMPDDEERKIELLQELRPAIEEAVARGRAAPEARSGLAPAIMLLQAAFKVQTLRGDIPAAIRPYVDEVGQALERLSRALRDLAPAAAPARLARLDGEFARWRDESRDKVLRALDPTPLGLEDLPAEVLDPYRGRDGTLALEIFPRLPDPSLSPVRDVLDPDFLPVFVAEMRGVDPLITGVSVQICESGTLIQNSYIVAGALGMLVVFLMLLADFQSLCDSLLALVPVIVGFAVTFGIMRLAGMQINAANIIVLPLMFGIGVDSGVQMLYRSRMDARGDPPGLTEGTGPGIILVNLLEIVGFGVLAIPYIPGLGIGVSHRGIQSLGFVLTCGMAMTLLACLAIMPAWLRIRRRAAARRGAD